MFDTSERPDYNNFQMFRVLMAATFMLLYVSVVLTRPVQSSVVFDSGRSLDVIQVLAV